MTASSTSFVALDTFVWWTWETAELVWNLLLPALMFSAEDDGFSVLDERGITSSRKKLSSRSNKNVE